MSISIVCKSRIKIVSFDEKLYFSTKYKRMLRLPLRFDKMVFISQIYHNNTFIFVEKYVHSNPLIKCY